MIDDTRTVEELGVFILAGRIQDAATGITESQEAEDLGFGSAWLCERLELKEAGAILGASAAATSHLGIATGPLVPTARPPLVLASLGATLQSLSGGRYTMGVGRGTNVEYFDGWGFSQLTYPQLLDYCGILKRLWSGERVDYEGPLGSYANMQLHDLPDGPPPEIVFCHNGGPRASKVAADPVFDGVMPCAMLSLEALRNSLGWSRAECERIGRDPATLRVSANVASAADMPDIEAQTLISVRIMFGLLLSRDWGRWQGWDMKVVDEVRNHESFANLGVNAPDQALNTPEGRAQIVEVARQLIPDSWLRSCAAVGSVSEGVSFLQEVWDIGVDEMVLYPATPAQNATLLAGWRDWRRPNSTWTGAIQ